MFLVLTGWIPTVNYDTKLRKIREWISIGMHGISAQWQLHARYLYIYSKVLIESFFNLRCGSISIDLFPSHIVPHYVLHLHHYAPWFRPLCICLAFRIVVFVWIMYCTLSHILAVTSWPRAIMASCTQCHNKHRFLDETLKSRCIVPPLETFLTSLTLYEHTWPSWKPIFWIFSLVAFPLGTAPKQDDFSE